MYTCIFYLKLVLLNHKCPFDPKNKGKDSSPRAFDRQTNPVLPENFNIAEKGATTVFPLNRAFSVLLSTELTAMS